MTTSQPARRTVVGSPVRQALGRWLRALRKLHNEEVYAWGLFFRAGLPAEGGEEQRTRLQRRRT